MRLPPRRAGEHQDGQVGFFHGLAGGRHPELAQGAGVVQPRGVQKDHRPHPVELKGLGHRVRGGAGQRGRPGEVACPVRALMREDFPALRRPNRPMCRRLA